MNLTFKLNTLQKASARHATLRESIGNHRDRFLIAAMSVVLNIDTSMRYIVPSHVMTVISMKLIIYN